MELADWTYRKLTYLNSREAQQFKEPKGGSKERERERRRREREGGERERNGEGGMERERGMMREVDEEDRKGSCGLALACVSLPLCPFPPPRPSPQI